MFNRWFMPDNKKRCYSYIRWSSEKQAKGTTLARQLATAQEIADKHGLELVELIDKGVSAFKGKNIEDGELGDFLDAVKSNAIPQDSWLVVENLDRLSREQILNSQTLFMNLLKNNITVVTGMDGKIYSRKSVNKNPMDLMYSIMLFARAHEESDTKKKRTYGNALAIIKKYQNGERAQNGYPFAIKSVGNNIWWSDCTDGTVKPHAIYYDVAKEMIELIKQGMGNYRMLAVLNKKGITPPTKNKHNAWSSNLVAKFHLNRALLGEKTINIDKVPYVLKDYYPALVDEETFYQLQHIKKAKTSKSTATKSTPLLSGIRVLKCGSCGGSMHAFTQREKPRYICGTGQQNLGCRAWSFNGSWVEDTVLRLAANHIFRPYRIEDDMQAIEQSLQAELETKQKEVTNLVDAVAKGIDSAPLVKRINELEAEIKLAEKKIEQAKQHKHTQLNETVEWGEVDAKVLDVKERELREKIRNKLVQTVTEIKCYQVEERHIFFAMTFINGKTILAHRTEKALAFDGAAWVKLSDHYGKEVKLSEKETAQLTAIENSESDKISQADIDNDFADLGELSKYIIDAPAENVGINTGYEYKGLFDSYSKDASKELAADNIRLEHLVTWADGFKAAPVIIEDQFRVYKHEDKKRVVKKPTPEIYYIEDANFSNETVATWQK